MRLFPLTALVFLLGIAACSPTQTVVVVRHAEKTSDGLSLSAAGEQRAASLKGILYAQKIDSVYSTNTKRTISTAQPTADSKGLPVLIYKNNKEMLSFLDRNNKDASFLVIGHSNTVPDLIRLCGCNYLPKDLADDTYNKFFVIKRRGGKCRLREREF